MARRLLRFLLLGALSSWPAAAHAHGGTWRPYQILVEPDAPNHIVLRSDAWGIVETHDGGATWQWMCSEAYGRVSLTADWRNLVVLPGGDLFTANDFKSISHSAGNTCEFAPLPFFLAPGRCGGSCVVQDVARGGGADRSLIAVTVNAGHDGGVANLLWRSPDGGNSWTGLPDTLPGDVGASTVGVAPSDPKQIYVTACALDQSACYPMASSDGGTTWTRGAPIDATGSTAYVAPPSFRVAAIHPTNPKIVFFRLDYTDNGQAIGGLGAGSAVSVGADQLYVSFDGGVTLSLVFQAKGDLSGLVFSTDAEASSVFVGGSVDGLFRARLTELPSKGRAAFSQVNTDAIWGLAWTPEGLLAGHDEFGAVSSARYSLGLSKDEGVTFAPLMVICDVTVASCAGSTDTGAACPALFSGAGNFQQDFEAPRCASTDAGVERDAAVTKRGDASSRPVTDAGPHPVSPGSAKDGGCGCSLPVSSRSRGGSSSLVLALALARRLRRRRAAARP